MRSPTYFDAMFSHEDYPPGHERLRLDVEIGSGAIHEAGHAAASFVLGRGNGLVSLRVDCTESDGDLLFSAGGEAQPAKHKCKPYTLRGPYSVGMLVLGVIACAGPAAETRHRLETKAPLRGLVRFSGDHSSVEIIDKYLAGRQGRHYHRYRGAFQRLA